MHSQTILGCGSINVSRTVHFLASPYNQDISDNYSTCTTPHQSVGDPEFTATLFADRMATAAYANSHTGAPQAALNRLAS